MNRKLTAVVKNLLIVNGLFFLATLTFGEFMFEKFSLFYPGSNYFMPHQIFTHMFMHSTSGFWHILGNMLALFFFGPALEMKFGPKRFLIYYAVTGIGAAALHTFINYIEIQSLIALVDPTLVERIYQEGFNLSVNITPGSPAESLLYAVNTPMVGASGAVFGILLAYGVFYPNDMIYINFIFPMKVKYFVMLYGAMELFLAFRNSPGDSVAHFAHLGGLLFGFLLIRLWRYKIL